MTRTSWIHALIATAMAAMAGHAAAATTPGSERIAGSFGAHLADLINDYREQQGLAPLAFADDLAGLAAEHSARMAARRQLSHDGFRDRYQRAGSRVCVENVGWNYPTAEALLDGWRQSPGHHRNLLEQKVSRMGIGVSTQYVTLFACR